MSTFLKHELDTYGLGQRRGNEIGRIQNFCFDISLRMSREIKSIGWMCVVGCGWEGRLENGLMWLWGLASLNSAE